jgi:flagellar biosynthesis anti-sigma factor FlgM
MSDIAPISRSNAPALSPRAGLAAAASTPPPRSQAPDKVELSSAAKYLSKLSELPDVRQDLVDRVKAQIAAGNYDTPEKIEAILDKLAEDLG